MNNIWYLKTLLALQWNKTPRKLCKENQDCEMHIYMLKKKKNKKTTSF